MKLINKLIKQVRSRSKCRPDIHLTCGSGPGGCTNGCDPSITNELICKLINKLIRKLDLDLNAAVAVDLSHGR